MSLISVSHLTFYYEGSADNIFEDVSFQIDTDWRLGFIARNGRGKTTFLKLLMGEYEYRGTISSDERFDYFPFAVREPEKAVLEVVEELYPDYEFWKALPGADAAPCGRRCAVPGVSTLSSGERTKVMLAVLFSKGQSFPAHRRAHEPSRSGGPRQRPGVPEGEKGLYPGVPRPGFSRPVRGSCAGHQPDGYRGVQRKFSTWWRREGAGMPGSRPRTNG